MKIRGSIIAIGVTLAMIISSIGLTQGQTSDEGLILRVAMQDDIKTLNPLGAGDVWTHNVLDWIYEGPTITDYETGELLPYIAVGSANLSNDLTTTDWSDCTIGNFGYSPQSTWNNTTKPEAIIFYDFENVTWHDGVQMTIRDVLFSYHVAAQMPDWTSSSNCLKENGGRPGSNFPANHVLFIEPVWWEGKDQATPMTSAIKVALKFTLQERYVNFFTQTLAIMLLPYHIWGTTVSGQITDNTKIWCDEGYQPGASDTWNPDKALAWDCRTNGTRKVVGSGIFKFDSWDPAGGISKIVTFREHFYNWGFKYDNISNPQARQPVIDGISFMIFRTHEAAVLALKNDEIDYIAWTLPPSFVGELSNEPGVTLQQTPDPGFFYLGYNMRRPSFGYNESKSFPYAPEDDLGKPLRRAIAHCIDKQFIVQRLLLNFGLDGTGPISRQNAAWYNWSIPTCAYDPDEAINILTNAGYKLTNPSRPPGEGNWWLNPNGTPIGSGEDGVINILTPPFFWDLRTRCPETNNLIVEELRKIGIHANALINDFGIIADYIHNINYDMYMLGCTIDEDPPEYLYKLFYSESSQNYPGYKNQSFDKLIDRARATNNETERKQLIFEAQAAIAYDLPYDVLYYRTHIVAYSSKNFYGWYFVEEKGLSRDSIVRLRPKTSLYYRINAKFIDPPSAMKSNETTQITIFVEDQNRTLVQGAQVEINVSMGALDKEVDNTTSAGKITVNFRAPYVESSPYNITNGTVVLLQIKTAKYTAPDNSNIYESASSRVTLITIYPEDEKFLSVIMTTESDLIDPDVDASGTIGFTYADVFVNDQDGLPVADADVSIEANPAILGIYPENSKTDVNGKARFTINATDLPDNDGSVNEFVISVHASNPDKPYMKNATQRLSIYVVDGSLIVGRVEHFDWTWPAILIVVPLISIAMVAIIHRHRKSKP